MFLTITTTHQPATDLGYLLYKHPDRVQSFRQAFGTATVFYPEASDERCSVALLLEIDAVRLARSRGRNTPDFSLGQYVNDRSYAASSLLGVAMADVFSTARSGRCEARQELADSAIDLEIHLPVLPCRGGPEIARRLFEPLGWTVTATPIELDETHPAWGASRYVDLHLSGTVRLADALNQLHVLLPVLDESKHYWQGADEIDKLLRSGGNWLVEHPEAELIARRYLGRHRSLARTAVERLAELAEVADGADASGADSSDPDLRGASEQVAPEPARLPLNQLRHDAVLAALKELGATSVIDLGCGPGTFLSKLAQHHGFSRVAGSDVSVTSLARAARALNLDRIGERQAERLSVFQGALTYADDRYAGYDAAVLMEVIEHVDQTRLPALESVVFGTARPRLVVVTTPNSEYNVNYETLTGMRHPDHRFEWTRAEFADWTQDVADRHGYGVEIRGIGEPDDTTGTPTQMALFTRKENTDD